MLSLGIQITMQRLFVLLQYMLNPTYTDRLDFPYFCLQNEAAAMAVEALTKLYGTEYKHGNHAETICKLPFVFSIMAFLRKPISVTCNKINFCVFDCIPVIHVKLEVTSYPSQVCITTNYQYYREWQLTTYGKKLLNSLISNIGFGFHIYVY